MNNQFHKSHQKSKIRIGKTTLRIRYTKMSNISSLRDRFAKISAVFILGHLVVLGVAANLSVSPSGTGLDPSWGWLTNQATQRNWFKNAGFIWTYGPTNFLDSQVIQWKVGFILALGFRLLNSSIFYYLLLYIFKKKALSDTLSTILALGIVSLSFIAFTPSLILILCLVLIYFDPTLRYLKHQNWIPFALAFISTIELLNKVMQGTIAIILSFAIVKKSKYGESATIKYVGAFCSFLIVSFAILGFNLNDLATYVRGQFELTKGYKAMASEPVGGLWEYFAFAFMFLLLLRKKLRAKSDYFEMGIFLLLSCIFFEYGFLRHDLHSITAFYFVAIFSITTLNHPIKLRESHSIIAGFTLVIMVGNLSVMSILDPSSRIINFTNILKLSDPRYRDQFLASDQAQLVKYYPMSSNIIAAIGKKSVAELPFDQLVGKAYQLNLVSPPIPQQYSIYTAWLDNLDAKYFSSKTKPSFVLFSSPRAIDGRNWKWEAPATQLAILCNYEAAEYDSNWLLLKKRTKQICKLGNFADSSFKGQGIGQLVSISVNSSFAQKIMSAIFKPPRHTIVRDNFGSWNLVTGNSTNLLINVDKSIDWPSIWSIGNRNSILFDKKLNLRYREIEAA
jgi:hypothetical protein